MIAILDKTCYTALKNHARTYSIFSALRQEKSPPCAMLFCSKALHLTRLMRFFRLMYSFVQDCICYPRSYSIFSTLRQEPPPPRRAMWFRSKALHLTRLVRFFRLMYSFVQRLYLLYMYLGLDVTCIFCNLSRQVKYRC